MAESPGLRITREVKHHEYRSPIGRRQAVSPAPDENPRISPVLNMHRAYTAEACSIGVAASKQT
jgi:hypothetical protein